MWTRAMLLAAMVVWTGCADAPNPFRARTSARPTTVLVLNHNWATANVYVQQVGSTPVRLGTVETEADETFTVPRGIDLIEGFSLVVYLVGGAETYNSGPLLVSPGSEVRLTIQNNLALSSVTIDR